MTNKILWKSEKRDIGDLKPFEGNPRKASEKEVEDLTKSLDRFDLADPLIINADGEVIGGNFRFSLLKSKGIKKIDVRVPSRQLTRKEAEELNFDLKGKKEGIVFQGYNPFIRQLRTDKGWRVEFDVSQKDYDLIKDLPKIEGRILEIHIIDKGNIGMDI